MEKHEYRNNQRMGPRRGLGAGGEKAKDLVGTWKKLLVFCRKYFVPMIIALLCAAVGTVLTLMGPGKLSDMTDTVTTGIKPDTERLTEIAGASAQSMAAGSVAPMTVDGVTISVEDQLALLELLSSADMEAGGEEAGLAVIEQLPASIYKLVGPSVDIDNIFRIAIVLVVMYAFSWIFSTIQNWTMATVTQRISKQMRTEISQKINRLPMWYYNRTSTGDVLSRVTNDVDTIGQSLNQSLGNLVHAIILFVGSFIMMLITDGWMTLAAVTASLLGFVLMFSIMGRSQKYFARQQKCLGSLNGHIEEMYAGHTVVKAYNGEEASGRTL